MELHHVHGAEIGTTQEPDMVVGGCKVNDHNSPQPLKHACVESL
jgi:hypothetical protein